MVAHENLKRIQRRLDARLNDPRVDRDLREKLYVMQRGRYYEHFTRERLMARYAVLLRQLAFLLDDFRDAPPEHCGFISSWWWIGRLIDIQEEFCLRGEEVPPLPYDGLARIEEPRPLVSPQRGDRTFIVRYSEMAFMQDLITNGTLRLGTASALSDGSLDPARWIRLAGTQR